MAKTRRSVLEFVALGTVGFSAGCASLIGDRCRLTHKIRQGGDPTIRARYEYEDLSQAAKTAFDGTYDTGGDPFSVEKTDDNNPPEFEYGDVYNYYEIATNGEVYVLATYTDEGC